MRKMIVGFDGSLTSWWILNRARELMRRAEEGVTLVAVEDRRRHRGPISDPRTLEEAVGRAAESLAGSGLAASVDFRRGNPGQEILRNADGGRDLVLLASHTHPGPDFLFFGSTALWVLHHATAPVVMFRPLLRTDGSLSPALAWEPAPLGRLLVAFDGSRDPSPVLPAALELGRSLGARLLLYGAVPRGDAGGSTGRIAERLSRVVREAQHLGLETEAFVDREHGPAGALDLVERKEADAIALSLKDDALLDEPTREEYGIELLRRALVPVLVVRCAAFGPPDGRDGLVGAASDGGAGGMDR